MSAEAPICTASITMRARIVPSPVERSAQSPKRCGVQMPSAANWIASQITIPIAEVLPTSDVSVGMMMPWSRRILPERRSLSIGRRVEFCGRVLGRSGASDPVESQVDPRLIVIHAFVRR